MLFIGIRTRKKKKTKTQNAIDVAMFLITPSAQNIYSAVLQTQNAYKEIREFFT